jgi:hypothetical protein
VNCACYDTQTIGIDPLIVHMQRTTGEELGYQCGLHFRWLRMLCWYNHFPVEPIGSRWVANAKYVYLGWCAPLPDEMRRAILKRIYG